MVKVKISRMEVEQMALELRTRSMGIRSAKVSYAVNRNLLLLEAELKVIRACLDLDGEDRRVMEEYEKRRMDLCRQWAKKHDGQPVMRKTRGGEEFVLADAVSFERELKSLRASPEFAEVLQASEARYEEVREMMRESVEVELYELDARHLPWDTTPEQMHPMMKFMVGEPPERPAPEE